jgi:hypothetical protein
MAPVEVALFTTSVGRPGSTVCPPIGDFALGALSVGAAAAAAVWEIVMDVPAIVSVAVRAAPVLAATVNCAVPLPLPLAPCVIVTNAALLVLVHAQPEAAVTVAVPVPPSAPKLVAGCATLYEQVVPDGAVVVELLLPQAAAKTAARTQAIWTNETRLFAIIGSLL